MGSLLLSCDLGCRSVAGCCRAALVERCPFSAMQPTMDHLTCFLPGNLALGAAYGPLTPSKAEAYLEVGH